MCENGQYNERIFKDLVIKCDEVTEVTKIVPRKVTSSFK